MYTKRALLPGQRGIRRRVAWPATHTKRVPVPGDAASLDLAKVSAAHTKRVPVLGCQVAGHSTEVPAAHTKRAPLPEPFWRVAVLVVHLSCVMLHGRHVERAQQVAVRPLQVCMLVARARAGGGIEEAHSLCRGEGEMVRTFEWRPGSPVALGIAGSMHARASSSST